MKWLPTKSHSDVLVPALQDMTDLPRIFLTSVAIDVIQLSKFGISEVPRT